MKVLITGATGLIGAALAARLVSRGHHVVRAARQPRGHDAEQGALAVDFSQLPSRDWWMPRLRGVDVVVNAVGIFQECGSTTFENVHTRAPAALFQAASDVGVRCVVQLSALGADEHATTRFHTSKRAADDLLRGLPVPSVIVQPSLVYDPEGTSAALFNRLALLPIIAIPASPAPLQPVHLEDLIEVLTRLIEQPPAASSRTVQAVGPEALTLKAYLLALRRMLGGSKAPPMLEVPTALALWGARALAAIVPRRASWVHPEALSMLARGNHADPSSFAQLLGRNARPVNAFLRGGERRHARERAQWSNLLATMRASVATVWIATGLLSLGLYPLQQSIALLAEFGLHGPWAWAALYLGGVLDLVLGVSMLLAPPRWRPMVYRAQIALILAYTVLITLRSPHWWLHPFGPILKNLPMLAGTAMLATLDRRP